MVLLQKKNRIDIREVTDRLSVEWVAVEENFKFKGDSMSFLGDTLIIGADENIYITNEKLKTNESMNNVLKKLKISSIHGIIKITTIQPFLPDHLLAKVTYPPNYCIFFLIPP